RFVGARILEETYAGRASAAPPQETRSCRPPRGGSESGLPSLRRRFIEVNARFHRAVPGFVYYEAGAGYDRGRRAPTRLGRMKPSTQSAPTGRPESASAGPRRAAFDRAF